MMVELLDPDPLLLCGSQQVHYRTRLLATVQAARLHGLERLGSWHVIDFGWTSYASVS